MLVDRERTRTLLLTWRNYPYCKRLSVRVRSYSIFPLSSWVQLCTDADNAVSPSPASWVNRLLSVNRACLWHSSLLHTIWFQEKFSPSFHAHCFCCSKEELLGFAPLRFCLPIESCKLCLELQPYLLFLLYVYSLIHMANISKYSLCSFLGNIWLHEKLWTMTSKHFHSYEESSAHEKITIQ